MHRSEIGALIRFRVRFWGNSLGLDFEKQLRLERERARSIIHWWQSFRKKAEAYVIYT